MFTVYESGFFSSARTQGFADIISQIKSEKLRNMTQTIRTLEGDAQDRLKMKLPVVMFSGTFVRNPNGAARINDFNEPSGYMVLDYDHIEDPEVLRLLREFLVAQVSTTLVFTSARGQGLKAVVAVCPSPTDNRASHAAFEVLAEQYRNQYSELDDSGKNLNRACFLSWDPDVYYNPNPVPIILGRHARALNLLDPDSSYDDWRTVIMALHSEDPESNLELAHAWSKRSKHYNLDELESKWSGFIQDGGITIRAIYELAGIPDLSTALISIDEDGLAAAVALLQLDIHWNIRTQRLILENNALSYNAQDSQLVRNIATRCSMAVGRSERPARFTKNMLYDWLPAVVPHVDAVKDYLESLPNWQVEDESVLFQLPEVLGVTEYPEVVAELFMKWILGIVTLQYDNRAPLDFAPILVGKQGAGKTRFVRELLPPQLSQYYADISLTSTPDVVKLLEKVIGCVIVEFSELQEGSKLGIGSLRSLLSSTVLKARLAYRHDAADYPVTWGIVGTANPGTGVLPESAEGRRWYAITTNIRSSDEVSVWLNDNRDAIWAEALALYRSGRPFQLSKETLEAHDSLNLGQEKPEFKATREFMAAGNPFDVKDLKEAAGVGNRLPRFMQGALSQAGWKTKVVRILGRVTTAYFPPDFDMGNWKEGVFLIEQEQDVAMNYNGESARAASRN